MYEQLDFRIPNEGDIEQLQHNFTRCDWKDDLINDIQEHYVDTYRVLVSRDEILGFANFYHTGYDILGQINIYVVSIECTKDKLTNNTQQYEFITNGRLLWAYILNNIYQINGSNPFIVYNHAIPDAYQYHIKMGMSPSNNYNLQDKFEKLTKTANVFDKSIKRMFLENDYLNNAGLSETAINSDEFYETYLFYISSMDVNYSDIHSILYSLPEGELRMKTKRRGGKTKRRGGKTKRRKTKRRKTKTNRRFRPLTQNV